MQTNGQKMENSYQDVIHYQDKKKKGKIWILQKRMIFSVLQGQLFN